jgi:hypothetical protein
MVVCCAEYKGHADEVGVKKVLKSDLDGMFKRCFHPSMHTCCAVFISPLLRASIKASLRCVSRRFPKDDHEMFDLKYIVRVSFFSRHSFFSCRPSIIFVCRSV